MKVKETIIHQIIAIIIFLSIFTITFLFRENIVIGKSFTFEVAFVGPIFILLNALLYLTNKNDVNSDSTYLKKKVLYLIGIFISFITIIVFSVTSLDNTTFLDYFLMYVYPLYQLIFFTLGFVRLIKKKNNTIYNKQMNILNILIYMAPLLYYLGINNQNIFYASCASFVFVVLLLMHFFNKDNNKYIDSLLIALIIITFTFYIFHFINVYNEFNDTKKLILLISIIILFLVFVIPQIVAFIIKQVSFGNEKKMKISTSIFYITTLASILLFVSLTCHIKIILMIAGGR